MLSRCVIPHIDDLGASYGANAAFLALHRAGRITCGSVMVPGPWFPHIAEAAARDPTLDLGVHLTLTSEWTTHRWAPISTTSPASGLIDPDGYFWHDVPTLRRHLVPEAAEAELRAQIERAITAGLRPTHIDAHMAAAMLPELLPCHIALAAEFNLVPILPRAITWPPEPAAYTQTLAQLTESGAPLPDTCRGTLPVPEHALPAAWAGQIATLPPGLTHLALHATTPGDFAAMSPQHAPWRFAEYAFLASGGLAELLAEHRIATTTTSALQSRWQSWRATLAATHPLALKPTVPPPPVPPPPRP